MRAEGSEALRFVARPRGIPSYWTRRRHFAPAGGEIEVRYLTHQRATPHLEQLAREEEIEAQFDHYAFEASLWMARAFAHYVTAVSGVTMGREEFALRGLFLLPPGQPRGHEMVFGCATDEAYEFVVGFRGRRAHRIRVDRDSDGPEPELRIAWPAHLLRLR